MVGLTRYSTPESSPLAETLAMWFHQATHMSVSLLPLLSLRCYKRLTPTRMAAIKTGK